ncbi:hypothetical protein QYF36_010503 [Acer negundo]|nr:hypothetical protein QYF36_010503 [Acer negundo]
MGFGLNGGSFLGMFGLGFELDSFGKLSCLLGFGFVGGSCYIDYCFQFGLPDGFSITVSWAVGFLSFSYLLMMSSQAV